MKKLLLEKNLVGVLEKRRDILRREDIKLYTASDVEEAFETAKAENIDAMIVDMDMPGGGGQKLCGLIRAEESLKKSYFVLVCSGSKAEMRVCESCGANSYITKPVDPESLYKTICHSLEIPERKGIRVLIKIQVEGRFKREPFFCTSRDLSISGILIETDKVLAKGDVISCSFYLPDTDRIDTRGEVVRVAKADYNAYNYGIQFLELHPESNSTIDTFVKHMKSEK